MHDNAACALDAQAAIAGIISAHERVHTGTPTCTSECPETVAGKIGCKAAESYKDVTMGEPQGQGIHAGDSPQAAIVVQQNVSHKVRIGRHLSRWNECSDHLL